MNGRKKPKTWKVPFHNKILIDLKARKLRTGEIARLMGFSVREIQNKSRQLGFSPDNRGLSVSNGDRDSLILECHAKGLSNTELASRFKLTTARIGQILKKAKESGKVF